ncbi:MAG TPA: 1,4-alpha-glucan branching protein GlgB [Candidatus Dormibacteraeota bacterium]|nr:1,4-alpha-glucan branching protein GlgB [Candidatus Dormibacteraeota bacterium]
MSPLTDQDLYLFNEGTHCRIYDVLGAHPRTVDGRAGTHFAVWAPNADHVSVIGDFNHWQRGAHPLAVRGRSGIWEGFIDGVGAGAIYKYHVASRFAGYKVDKADPLARRSEVPPHTGSIVALPAHDWRDAAWMAQRAERQRIDRPQAIYEVHLGSWQRAPEDPSRLLTYAEVAPRLAAYARDLGFTHVELLPVMEHPFYASWGYQTTGYFAPTARYGTPEDFMAFVDVLHQHGVGVILDWVPSHFPADEHGLAYFDGTHLYEHADPRQGFHPDWGSLIFNYGRNEVRSFLLSSAHYWLDRFHVDGLRVDAVASMLYLDYSRRAGEWIPNRYGGRENVDAIDFLRQLNRMAYTETPGVQTAAEESTSWPMVSRPPYVGGLGFGFKWDMGWMHDMLAYLAHDPIYRRFHHTALTFRMLYAFSENFILPLSHDEVVHGKSSLIGKMAGDDWQRFANLRLLLAHQWTQPGKKLLFMGGEFAQRGEWRHDHSLDWHLLAYPPHQGVQRWVRELNRVYTDEPCLHEHDCDWSGFEWIDCNDSDASVISYLRRGTDPDTAVVVVLNFTPIPRHGYRIGVPFGGTWRELLNSDAHDYGGSGQGNFGGLAAVASPHHGRPYRIDATLPPLGAVLFRGTRPR